MILFPSGRPEDFESFDDYVGAGGYASLHESVSPVDILNAIDASGLRGRGGAGFPVGRKWVIAAETPADRRYVICNAGEDEPGSLKDRVLLENRPHLVLEGILLACRAIGAQEGIVYLNETYEKANSIVQQAIQEANLPLPIRIQKAPTVYVAGEDSACLEVLEGKPPLPRQKPPYPAVAGLFGQPTVVNNVETLANVPLIIRNGPAWFRGFGTVASPGSMIFSLGEEVNNPGVYELPFGASLRHLFEDLGGGLKSGKSLKSILPGGPSCAFISSEHLDVALDPDSMKAVGSSLGCGVMRFYSQDTCMVEETLKITQFFARESCGQCPACRMETNMLVMMLGRIESGEIDASVFEQLEKVLEFNRGKGYCALVNMPGAPILSAVRLFKGDFEHHLQHGRCAHS